MENVMKTTGIARPNSAVTTLLLAICLGLSAGTGFAADESVLPGGELQILDEQGQMVGACPLKHTDVQADIVGFVGRVTVTQTFHNPLDKKIEAVYVFPLPQDAAVDDMVMTVGDRRIVGQIKEREEAREIYEAAKAAGCRPCGELARPGATEHLHAVGRQHRARR